MKLEKLNLAKQKQELECAKELLAPFEVKVKEAKAQLDAAKEELQEATQNMSQFVEEYHPYMAKISQLDKQQAELKDKMANLTMVYEEALKEFKSSEALALELCDGKRVENP